MAEKNIIEKNIHRTNLQRAAHTLCLILPIAAAFAGYFLSPFLWSRLNKNETPELFKFGISLLFFLIPTIVIFATTRKSDSIIKIRIITDKQTD